MDGWLHQMAAAAPGCAGFIGVFSQGSPRSRVADRSPLLLRTGVVANQMWWGLLNHDSTNPSNIRYPSVTWRGATTAIHYPHISPDVDPDRLWL